MSLLEMNGNKIVVTVRIGKKGLTENVLREIEKVLDARGIVKVKLLQNFRSKFNVDKDAKTEIASILRDKLGAEVVDIRGYIITLRKRR